MVDGYQPGATAWMDGPFIKSQKRSGGLDPQRKETMMRQSEGHAGTSDGWQVERYVWFAR